MTIQIEQFSCLDDNYGLLIRDEESGETACIDTPDADVILSHLRRLNWSLTLIMNTHWRRDHAGGNHALKQVTGASIVGPAEVAKISQPDRVVAGGDVVTLGATHFAVLDTGGHTHGHISYYAEADSVVFVGDTLFALGCGRLFEGDAAQMWESLGRLAALPDQTEVYCAHEYTEANARFALTVDGDPELRARAEGVFAQRRRGEPTVPTTIGLEKRTNPFLRAPIPRNQASDVAAFAELRAAKANFRG